MFDHLPFQSTKLAHAHIVESADTKLVAEACINFTSVMVCTKRQEQDRTPCGQCQSCLLYAAGNHPDVLTIGEEGLSVGVEEVRSVATFLNQTPHIAGRQIVLINNADKMTENAANAVLKTLEEPTANSYILLMSENRHNQMATILSRCQVWPITPDGETLRNAELADMPNYLVGFSGGIESKLAIWHESGDESLFIAVYQSFLNWLKGQETVSVLVEQTSNQQELPLFLLYLIERRIRQLMLKNVGQNAIDAEQKLTQYRQMQANFRNQSAQVALTSLLLELEYLIR